MPTDIYSTIYYYARRGFYHHLSHTCENALRSPLPGVNAAHLKFWKAFGLIQQHRTNEALRELDDLRGVRDLDLPVLEAQLYALQRSTSSLKDDDAIADLRAQIPACERRAQRTALLTSAHLALFTDQLERAAALGEAVAASQPSSLEPLVLRGWLGMRQASGRALGECVRVLEQVLGEDELAGKEGVKLEALMARAACFVMERSFGAAIELYNTVIAYYRGFTPALVEKAKLLALMGEWEQALETAERVIHVDADNIDAHQVAILYKLVQGSVPHKEVATALQALFEVVDRLEPRNAELFHSIAACFARLAGTGNATLLAVTTKFIEKAKQLTPTSEVITELAYQAALMQKYERAQLYYENASDLDSLNMRAIYGQIYCSIQKKELGEAAEHLEPLSRNKDTIESVAELTFIEAMLTQAQRQEGESSSTALRLLNQAIKLHLESVQKPPASDVFEFFTRLNACFLVEVSQQYLKHCSTEPVEPNESPPKALRMAIKILQRALKQAPGFLDGQLALARAHFLENNCAAASKAVKQALSIEPALLGAHVLAAQIHLQEEDFAAAENALEIALSHNFQIRNSAVYQLLKARVQRARGNLAEALTILEVIMDLPGVRGGAAPKKKAAGKDRSTRRGRQKVGRRNSFSKIEDMALSTAERVNIFIEYCSVLLALQKTKEAGEVIREAQQIFKGTGEEVRVLIIKAEIALKNGDPNKALRMLNEVGPSSPAFLKAHMVKADIYLNFRGDKQAYTNCFAELVDNNPCERTYVLLAEAYMKVRQVDKAIDAFRQALRNNPSDSELARKIGKALLSTYDFPRAIEYYKSAVRSANEGSGKACLRYDLANLYLRLQKLEQASKVIEDGLQELSDSPTQAGHSEQAVNVNLLRLLAKVRLKEDDQGGAYDTLEKAKSLQMSLVASLRSLNSSDTMATEKEKLAEICKDIGDQRREAGGEKSTALAIEAYKEALRHNSGHIASMLALARVYQAAHEPEKCQQMLTQLSRIEEDNQEAAMMLAELAYSKGDFGVAAYHYQQLLRRSPDNFEALARLIRLLYSAGKLADAQAFIQTAERSSSRSAYEPGFNFCQGLLYKYKHAIKPAVSSFNKARSDAVWGDRAIAEMVKIYLRPDGVKLWEEVDMERREQSVLAIETAGALLKGYRDKTSLEYNVLESYTLMASKGKQDIDQAFQKLLDVVNAHKDYVPAILALCTAFMIKKHIPKARNELKKRVLSIPYNQDHAEEFEESWLLLAEIYMQSQKYDLAQALCKKCLEFNKSSAPALECMGLIMEKQAAYVDSAEHYELAWNYQNEASASVGYKLAFNYLKAKKYAKAIDIAKKVLKQYPDYPKIREDVLRKAYDSLRP